MKRIIAFGGGDMQNKTTLEIDKVVAEIAKNHAGDKRAFGLYLGTASHDFMPAFNTFRKIYTSVFDIKADCVITEKAVMDEEKINAKFEKADFIFVGGGDTVYMLQRWKETGLLPKIISAYERGVTIVGRSAGAVCWFKDMYTDSYMLRGESNEYKFEVGLNVLEGLACPHYNLRSNDFDIAFKNSNFTTAYAIEDNSALLFEEGKFIKALSSGGNSYLLSKENGEVIKKQL